MLDETKFTPHGRHLIAGEWVAGEATFRSEPATAPAHEFAVGTPALVDRAAEAAEEAFWAYGYTSREERAAFLERIADEIEARAEAITEIGTSETGLPAARLEGERGRTTGQLRLFASHIRKGDYLDRRHDVALPDRKPLPRPDLRMIQRPIGPVAVFGASNFPLAFSTAGGDTAAALAAGCPVVVKGHSAHPGTGEIVAEAIHAAIQATGMPPGRVLADPGRQARRRHGAGAAPADQGGGLHRLARRGPRALRPLRRAARADPVLRRAGLGQPDVPAARRRSPRAAPRSARAGPVR